MNESNGASADRTQDMDGAWDELYEGLSDFLVTMTDPDDGDHLIVELPGDDETGSAPYVQFASFGGGTQVRAEIAGDAHLMPAYRLGASVAEVLRELGWAGNDADEPNWYVERTPAELDRTAWEVANLLKTCFGIAHPQLLTYQAWGPAAAGAQVLGLCATADVPAEASAADSAADSAAGGQEPLARSSSNSNELLLMVASALEALLGGEPVVDDDGDFVLEHLGHAMWVQVMTSQPTVRITARVAYDVKPSRVAPMLVARLNRDHLYAKWSLEDGEVWQTIVFPALPFAPDHLRDMLHIFRATLDRTCDEIVTRTGAQAG